MSRSGLMLPVTHKYFLVGEAGSKCLSTGNQSASIVAQVDNQSVAWSKIEEYLIQISLSELVFKSHAAQIAKVVVQDSVAESRRYAVVCPEIPF